MRKRSLGLLLALVIIVPNAFGTVSYAGDEECQHDHAYNYDETSNYGYDHPARRSHRVIAIEKTITYCPDCDTVLSSVETPIEWQEYHSYDENSKCTLCGYVNDCQHEDIQENYRVDWDSVDDLDKIEYIPIDDLEHQMISPDGFIIKTISCDDCGMTLEEISVTEGIEHHSYENGVCEYCDHENKCSHENMPEPSEDYNPDDAQFIVVDDQFHSVSVVGWIGAYCPDCDTVIKTKENVIINKNEPHYYQDGECMMCGHKNPCLHPHMEGPKTEWNNEDVVYEAMNDREHSVKGTGILYTYCPDCEERRIIDDYVEIDEVERHLYNEEGMCEYCKHKNECQHSSLEDLEPYWNPWDDNIEKTSMNSVYHRYFGTCPLAGWCPDCNTMVITDQTTQIDQIGRHWYYEGECELCHYKLENKVNRIFGSDRYETSRKVANQFKKKLNVDKLDTVILASGNNYPDALAGSYLSYLADAPILLVNSSQEQISAVKKFISKNVVDRGKIYILGGTGVIPEKVESALTEYNTVRLYGDDRFETNIAILKETAKYSDDSYFIACTGYNFPDSLSAAALKHPILLVGNTLSKSQKEYLNRFDKEAFFTILGGPKVVSEVIEDELGSFAYSEPLRIFGENRYETSVKVAAEFFNRPKAGVLAYGQNFPDGLCGGILAASVEGPLILAANGSVQEAEIYAAREGMSFGSVLGGPALINDVATKKIFHMEPSDPIY